MRADAPWRLSSGAVLGLVWAIFTARWVWIAGLGDYGWTYELGMRVGSGEVPCRDFIATLPPSSSYTLVPFLVVLKGSLWAYAVHLYLWWLASLVVGWKLVKRLSGDDALVAAAVFLAGCLSFPAATISHAYTYAVTALMGGALLNVLAFQKSGRGRDAILCGLWCGLAVFSKQNVGCLLSPLAALSLVYVCITAKRSAEIPRTLFLFALGFLGVFVPVMGYLGAHAGLQETILQLFVDAGKGKGGFTMLIRALPVFYFEPDTPHRQILGLAVSLGTFALFCVWFNRQFRRAASTDSRAEGETTARDGSLHSNRLLWSALGIVFVTSLVSLFDLATVKVWCESLRSHYRPDYYNVFWFPLYCALTAFFLMGLARAFLWRNPVRCLCFVWLAGMVFSHSISNWHLALPYAATVVVPLAFWLFRECGLVRDGRRLACGVGAAAVLVFTAFPSNTYFGPKLPMFEPLVALPGTSPFAGLRASGGFAAQVEERLRHVTPEICGRRTLWLCYAGPQLAYGGKPVRAVALPFFDTYHARSEAGLMDGWRADPPEFVVFGSFPRPVGTKLFTAESLQAWLSESYEFVYQERTTDASLWRLKPNRQLKSNE